jgi:23S rRNA (cytidine1920-2'-O)/16S rRNA (cytidine1409-2'-O)-methyltransferase
MKAAKERLDVLLVRRGLAASRERARALILAGRVVCDHHLVDKAGHRVPVDADIRLKGEDIPYVSRGGVKLAAALERFAVDPAGRVALDVGASTGGFTHCLLQRGARRVYAVDVGYGQLAWELARDPRVVVMDRTNIRQLTQEALPEPPELVVIDVSFISLNKVLPVIAGLTAGGTPVIALFKPQFEVGRAQVGKGGIVRDPEVRRQALESFAAAAPSLGFAVLQTMTSPIRGQKGNEEFLLFLRRR